MSENIEWQTFLNVMYDVEKDREFDRKVDRLKKSSSATTVWAVIPGLFGIYGIAHFYLNKPIEGLLILLTGMIPSFFLTHTLLSIIPGYSIPFHNLFSLSPSSLVIVGVLAWIFRIGFFIGNIISARYQYSKYEFYIHWKAKKPWNNWGLKPEF